MLLCIDVGNTQIALGLYADSETAADAAEVRPPLVHGWRMRTDPRMTADEFEAAVRSLIGDYTAEIHGVAALSTVPTLLREIRLLLNRRPDVPSVVVGPGVRTGVPLLVDNPREVGADRVVNTLAAHRIYGTTCIVVDFGTSTSVDVVSSKGEFLGGAIAPGVEISMEALATRAAALRTVELVRPRTVIGKNTVECLQAGVLYGFAGQVDGLVRRILLELGPAAGPVTVLGTGGLAPLIVDESETIDEHVPDLTLLGLRLVYLRNVMGDALSSRGRTSESGRRSTAAPRG